MAEAAGGRLMRAIGLMSGTSLDGIDVALIDSDGAQAVTRGSSMTVPYPADFRKRLVEAIAAAKGLTERAQRSRLLAAVEQELTERHADAVNAFIDQNGIARQTVNVIGFHGQTVLHRPEKRMTVQIGDAAALAKTIHIPVMHDFRAADVAAGGQGAPFVPVYHRALTQSLEREGPIAVVNIGGVANITYIDGTDTLIACDTGPGNALIDDLYGRFVHDREESASDPHRQGFDG